MTTAPVGILLAAGKGRRFAPWGGHNKLLHRSAEDSDPVVVASARAMLAVLPLVIAVVPPDDVGVAQALQAAGCSVTVCPDADSGMAASLVHAIGHSLAGGAQAWLIGLGDMPYVQPATVAALRRAIEDGADIAVPVFDGRRGNPVAFGHVHLPALLALQGDQGARALLAVHPVTPVAVNDPGIFHDIDIPSDLKTP